MSAAHYNMFGHVVKRGVAAAQEHFSQAQADGYVNQLKQDAELYDQSGIKELSPIEFLPIIITAFVTIFIIASIRYTIGDVMASLAMIESPSSTAIIEPKQAPPPYTDEPDSPLEKEPLMPVDAEADVEVTIIDHKPITSKITTTIGHLHRTGGFFSRWRGLGISMLYHALHGFSSNTIAYALNANIVGNVFVFIFVSLGMARLHALWTHSMIAKSSKPWYRRFVTRKQSKALLLPSLVYAAAQQATFLLPVGVAFALNVHGMHKEQMTHDGEHMDCGKMVLMGLRFLAIPATALFVALAVLLPAAVTLTRIEATLLAEDEQTIVPFDRQAIMEGIDPSVRGGCRALFVQAWRSFDRSARLRLIKLYVKMVLAQFTVFLVGLHLAVAELFLIGPERLSVFFKSAFAQLRLMAIEAAQNRQAAVDAQIN